MRESTQLPDKHASVHHYPLARLDMAAAAAALQNGQIIAYPTETYFGVGGTALSSHAAAAVFRAKRRPNGFALPIIINSRAILDFIASGCSPLSIALMDAFWPGPLTILLPASKAVPEQLIGSSGCIAVRKSPHPVAQALCKACQGAIISSSANISGQPPAIRPEDLDPELTKSLAGVVDVPPLPTGGAPSTLVQAAADDSGLRILRAGAVSREELEAKGFRVLS